MYYVILGTDRPGTGELRLKTRPAHREYLNGKHDEVTLRLSGPTMTPDGAAMSGSLIVVEAESLEAVERFSANDPFRLAGLFDKVEIRPWDWHTGNPAQP